MKTIVILGNGFDIDLGLNTKFKSFIASTHFAKHAYTPLLMDISTRYLDDDNWCNIEEVFRSKVIEYVNNPSSELYYNINQSWQLINKAWGIYLPEITELDRINIKRETCAYSMLKHHGTSSIWYTFNYTMPFYLSGFQGQQEPIPVHGWYAPREQTPEGNMFHIPKDLVIGIDSNAIPCECKNTELNHIVKRNHPHYNANDFVCNLHHSDNIIIFGHSLGITDSDYFSKFFNSLTTKDSRSKNLFFVTYDAESMKCIKENIKKLGVEIDEIIDAGHKVSYVYTSNGASDADFMKLLTYL